MTGYAITFNIRHRRSGHLFQNRYKSVICEEDPYLLELIRYIHLNPLCAKLVQDLKELDKSPWTGHSALLGKRKDQLIPNELDKHNKLNRTAKPNKPEKSLSEKTIEDALLRFGETKRIARKRYREFVKNGVDQGKRPEFQGGGLVRSAGGNKTGLLGRKKEEREKGDARILGSGDFVEELIEIVAQRLSLEPKLICSGGRQQKYSKARSLVAWLSVEEVGHSAAEVTRFLGISRMGVQKAVIRGTEFGRNEVSLGQ